MARSTSSTLLPSTALLLGHSWRCFHKSLLQRHRNESSVVHVCFFSWATTGRLGFFKVPHPAAQTTCKAVGSLVAKPPTGRHQILKPRSFTKKIGIPLILSLNVLGLWNTHKATLTKEVVAMRVIWHVIYWVVHCYQTAPLPFCRLTPRRCCALGGQSLQCPRLHPLSASMGLWTTPR